jgi:uncharacterized protein (DUF885 family)
MLQETQNLVDALGSLNPNQLLPQDEYTYTLLRNALQNSLSMTRFPYYDEPLSPSSGMQTQLPILLAEYTFRSTRDVDDYLKLLNQTDEYFDSLILYEQENAKAGLLMSGQSLHKVLDQCEQILVQGDLHKGTHFLQTTFVERLSVLYTQGLIDLDRAKYYVAQNNRLLSTVFAPAYEALYDGLFVLCDETIPLRGLANYPNGDTYYELLLKIETGSDMEIERLKEVLTAKLEQEFLALNQLFTTHPQIILSNYAEEIEEAFPLISPSQMLLDLQERMEKDFPLLEGEEPSVLVKAVSQSLEEYCAPAYYLTPPIDDSRSNVIYINELHTPHSLELYTTLAHEGFPGHLYQTVYHNQQVLSDEDSYVREILWYGGYQEGWALYVEFLAFDYAAQLLTQAGRGDLAPAVYFEQHNRSLLLCLYSLLDIMIHYDGASYDTISQVLEACGITSEASVSAIYEYLVEEPTNYLKYYLGYLEILALQSEAKQLWGAEYTDYDFHKFLLDCGPSDFSTIRKAMGAVDTAGFEKAREGLPLLTARN